MIKREIYEVIKVWVQFITIHRYLMKRAKMRAAYVEDQGRGIIEVREGRVNKKKIAEMIDLSLRSEEIETWNERNRLNTRRRQREERDKRKKRKVARARREKKMEWILMRCKGALK